ncbi:MAG: hypothetical protein AABX16_03780 [Nanoarchaeota archaeon]
MKKNKASLDNKSLLREAIADINKELVYLKKEKRKFKKQISGLDCTVEKAHLKEEELKNKIAKLLEKETRLTENKKSTQIKIDRLSDKLGKIEKIKYEMSDV